MLEKASTIWRSYAHPKKGMQRRNNFTKRAFTIDEAALGPNHPAVAIDLNNLAELYRTQKKYDEAEPLYQQALHINELALGAEHPHVALALNNLALLHKAQEKYAEAKTLYQRALVIYERALGLEHPNTRQVRGNYEELLNKMRSEKP